MSQDSMNTPTEQIEDDRPLWDIVLGVYGYPALLLAHKLKIFPLLADGPLSLTAICDKLNIKARPAEAIFGDARRFLSLLWPNLRSFEEVAPRGRA